MKPTSAFPTSHRRSSMLDPADQAILNVLEHDWRRMCGFDVAPAMRAMDPTQLDAALPHAFLLHRVEPGVARIRVAGQRLHDMLQFDPRGMSFTAFFGDSSRETATALLDHAFDMPAVLGVSMTAARGLGRKPVRAEALFLPMRDNEGQLTRMMGAIVTSGPLPGKPLRFDIAKGQPLRCDPLFPGFADRRANRGRVHSAPAAPQDIPRQAGPQLRLVVDNTV